jgi:hypothetical protein
MPQLFSLYIPESVETFGTNIFLGRYVDFIIFGEMDSAAQRHARNNNIRFEVYGNFVTLTVDASTNRARINVSGTATPGSVVRIYDNNTEIARFTANRAHRYNGIVQLLDYGMRTLKAEIRNADGTVISDTRTGALL